MNNMMVREIHGAKINPKSSLKNLGSQNRRGRGYAVTQLVEAPRYKPKVAGLIPKGANGIFH
jgi:hypothetical protein